MLFEWNCTLSMCSISTTSFTPQRRHRSQKREKKSSLSVSQHERTEKNDAAVPSAHGKKREKTQLSSSAVYLHFSHVHRNFKGGREGEIYYATNVCSFAGKEEFRRIFFPSQCVSHVRAHDARDFIADHTFLIKNIAVWSGSPTEHLLYSKKRYMNDIELHVWKNWNKQQLKTRNKRPECCKLVPPRSLSFSPQLTH